MGELLVLLKDLKITPRIRDERVTGATLELQFTGKLRPGQETASPSTPCCEPSLVCEAGADFRCFESSCGMEAEEGIEPSNDGFANRIWFLFSRYFRTYYPFTTQNAP